MAAPRRRDWSNRLLIPRWAWLSACLILVAAVGAGEVVIDRAATASREAEADQLERQLELAIARRRLMLESVLLLHEASETVRETELRAFLGPMFAVTPSSLFVAVAEPTSITAEALTARSPSVLRRSIGRRPTAAYPAWTRSVAGRCGASHGCDHWCGATCCRSTRRRTSILRAIETRPMRKRGWRRRPDSVTASGWRCRRGFPISS